MKNKQVRKTPTDREIHKRLEQCLPDNPEWTLAFDDDGHVMNFEVDRLAGGREPSPWSQEAGAQRRMTPDTARIPVCDDLRFFGAFAPRDVPALKLAGERDEHFFPGDRALRVGVMTTGGNAPGLNLVVDSITKRHHEYRRDRKGAKPVEVYAYEGGVPGLLNGTRLKLVPSKSLRKKSKGELGVRDVLVTDEFALDGCTRIKTLRGEIEKSDGTGRKPSLFDRVAKRIMRDHLNVLHLIGGDGTMRLAAGISETIGRLDSRYKLAIVCATKTMDNDVLFADPSFGFFSVVDDSIDFIRRLAHEAESQDRLVIIQLFGAASGFVALYAAYCSGEVDWVVIPEMLPRIDPSIRRKVAGFVPFDPPRVTTVKEFVDEIETFRENMANTIANRLKKKGHAVLVTAEGATPVLASPEQAATHHHGDEFRKIKDVALAKLTDWLKGALKDRGLSNGVMDNFPKHLIRAAGPNGFDAALCKYVGKLVVDNALFGYTNCTVSMWHGRPVLVPLRCIVGRKRFVLPNGYFAASMLRRLTF